MSVSQSDLSLKSEHGRWCIERLIVVMLLTPYFKCMAQDITPEKHKALNMTWAHKGLHID